MAGVSGCGGIRRKVPLYSKRRGRSQRGRSHRQPRGAVFLASFFAYLAPLREALGKTKSLAQRRQVRKERRQEDRREKMSVPAGPVRGRKALAGAGRGGDA